MPMPTPPIMRYTTSWSKVAQTAHPTAETVNSSAESIITGLRPRRSLSTPATDTPAIEPMRAQPTYQPWLMGSRP